MAELLADHGCGLSLGDSPGLESLPYALRGANFTLILARYNIAVADFHSGADVASRNRRWFPKLFLSSRLGEFDHLVNLSKFKPMA